ncbi:signal transduction histidine kinase [Zhongshania antarctica]|uniref:histidine kinase n=1 Tax=Zhongshania antarctica TaxID=641702 RepID=A0A840R329_9GAMM|nr:ATP-binding protein [Zhongshania antarctica]MBB5187177.1 signal transduction histidine kinase [Zhongshania antarctica]
MLDRNKMAILKRRAGGFTLQRLLVVLAVSLALSLIVFLLWKMLRNPLETGLHVIRLEQIDSAAKADVELNQQILRARLALESGARELELARDRFDVAQSSLSSGKAGLSDLSRDINQSLQVYRTQAGDKLTLLNDYSARLARLAQYFSVMRVAGISVLNAPAVNSSESLRKRIMMLLQEATAYSLQSSPENAFVIDQLAAEVGEAAEQLDNDAARGALGHLLETVSLLRSSRDDLQKLIGQFDAIETGAALQSLQLAYEDHFQGLQDTARRYRQTLAVYAVALLLAFGLIAVRLRSSFSALDSANNELQDTNSNLEQIVNKRTQALSKALDDLKMQQGQLIQSEKMASLGQMVAGVAHEINTPLGYASSNVEIIRESLQGMGQEVDAESLEEFDVLLADVEYGLNQISELVMSLKDFSRVDRSQSQLFDLNAGIDTALKICNNQLKDGVSVERNFAELPEISCAPSQLNQVFLNLINNAAQAMDGQGLIQIATRQVDGDVEVAIRDNGSGMDEDTRAHIFEPFFTTKAVGKGTGLGLSIVFRIIEDHGGTIQVESELGKGTEFVVRLPIKKAGKAADVSPANDVVLLGE